MVNIKDVERSELPKGDRLVSIFRRQEELMEKYEHIEKENEFYVPNVPVNLHDRMDQARIKDFAWRITEELAESVQAFIEHPGEPLHHKEEIADALHFLVELTIMCGILPHEIPPVVTWKAPRDMLDLLIDYDLALIDPSAVEDNTYIVCVGKVVVALGVMCNFLKNKPWKKTHMLTDTGEFKKALLKVWVDFSYLAYAASIGPQELFELYFGKSDVNKFRQRSDY